MAKKQKKLKLIVQLRTVLTNQRKLMGMIANKMNSLKTKQVTKQAKRLKMEATAILSLPMTRINHRKKPLKQLKRRAKKMMERMTMDLKKRLNFKRRANRLLKRMTEKLMRRRTSLRQRKEKTQMKQLKLHLLKKKVTQMRLLTKTTLLKRRLMMG